METWEPHTIYKPAALRKPNLQLQSNIHFRRTGPNQVSFNLATNLKIRVRDLAR